MTTDTVQDLKSFHEFISGQLHNGGASLSPEECVNRWRSQLEREETIAAIREGLADFEAGRFRTFEEFDAEFRRIHNIPQDADL